jgi:hypothetical protein
MSVEITVFNSLGGFSSYPRLPSDADKLIQQFKADLESNNSRVIFNGVYENITISFISTGNFNSVTPGMTVDSFFQTNAETPVFDQEIYLNGELSQVSKYLAPTTVEWISADTYKNLSALYSSDDVIYAPVATNRQGGIDFFGYGGNDKFYAYGSHEYDDVFFGGEGVDSLIYSGSKTNYSITASQTIWNPVTEKGEAPGFFIRDNTGRDGDVQISEVERIVFSESAIGFDTNGVAGQAYRIYKAAFDRAPDLTGLGFWINAMDKGAALTGVAGGFIGSEEFQSRYGQASDMDFIKLLYENVLDRQPDAGGYAFWQDAMARGLSREGLLIEFSDSEENKANVAGLIANGIEYTPFIS